MLDDALLACCFVDWCFLLGVASIACCCLVLLLLGLVFACLARSYLTCLLLLGLLVVARRARSYLACLMLPGLPTVA